MKKALLTLLAGIALLLSATAQTVFSDNFNTSAGASYTVANGAIGTSVVWNMNRSGADMGARINGNILDLTNDGSGTANANGTVYAYTATGSFSAPYNTTLNASSGVITWTFNMRQIRTDPSGFAAGNYGVAFILGSTSTSPGSAGNGYAVVLGQSGATDNVRLVEYTGGLSGTITNLVSGSNDFGTNYLSIKVTYSTCTNQWELFVRDDGASAFADPLTGTLTSQGTAGGGSYTGTALPYMGGFWNSATAANQTAFFDNVTVAMTTCSSTPAITTSLSTQPCLNYITGFGPSYSRVYTLSGASLTPAAGNLTVTAPANFEVSTNNVTFSASVNVAYTGGTLAATPIYVRLAAGLPAGSYGPANVTNAGGGATTQNVSVSGNVITETPVSTLAKGDLAIVSVIANNALCSGVTTEDEISFLLLKPIANGITIDLTDNGYERVNAGLWGTSEGTVRFTRTGGPLPSGTIITFKLGGSVTPSAVSPDNGWSVTNLNTWTAISQIDMNNGGDQLHVMQGGTWNVGSGLTGHDASYTGGTILFAFNTGTSWTSFGGSTQQSGLYPGMNCFSMMPAVATDFIKYTGPQTAGTQRDWIDRINTSTNWTSYASCTALNAAAPDYRNNGVCWSVTPIGFSPGIWQGGVSTDWFNCENWQNLIVPDATTNVTIDQTAVNNCVVGVSPTGTAVCNNLSLSSNSGTNRDLIVQNAATLTCGGDITFAKTAGAGVLSLSVLNTATLTCNNLSVAGTASGADNARFLNETSFSNVYVNGNFTLNNGGRLDLSSAPTDWGAMHIRGNYTNNGLETDFHQTNSLLYLDGNANQTVNTAGFTEVFATIVVNKAGGTLTFNTPADVENDMNFMSGLVYTSAINLLNFRDNAVASNMSNTSFVDGPVRKTGDDAFTFPVGDGTNYQPATISAPGSTADHFTAQYFQVNPHPTYNENSKDPTLDHISNCEYWIIDRTGGASNVNVTLSWDANSCGVTNLGDLRVARWDGTMWKDHGNGGTTGNTSAGTVITSAPVTSFSPFTLSSISVENPLPVELISFTGQCTADGTQLQWITASEQNNDYFTLEKSTDGVNYTLLTTVDGAGNANELITYTYTDGNKSAPGNYYRLTQTDYNGDFTVFAPLFVPCSASDEASNTVLHTFQTSTGDMAIGITSAENQWISIHLTDASGRHLAVWQREAAKGVNQWYIHPGALSSGMYTLRFTGKNFNEAVKFIYVR